METCVRGFSFMADLVDKVDLQYIEGGELERTWKNARRERAKQREQKIWDEFINEKDIVSVVSEDDQYQFLDPMSEEYMKEMMDDELERLKKEIKSEEDARVQQSVVSSPNAQLSNSSLPPMEDHQNTCVVTFAEDHENEKDECDMFHIFDDERDIPSPGPDDEGLNDSMHSLPTVRERLPEQPEDISQRPSSGNNTSSTGKSSENVTDVIESSIYCAKVKDLRLKINEEILNMMTALDRRDVFSMEQEDMSRMIKRSVEFCARFNRIYMYQLQRQMHDIKRNNSLTLPFAKHTQFQSQMVRIVSLHQNLLQSFQVFRKSVEQTWCVRESVSALGSLVGAARAATQHAAAVTQPKGLTAAQELYNDSLLASCDKLEDFVNEYTIRCEEFLNSFVNLEGKPPKKPKSAKTKTKKRPIGLPRTGLKTDIDPGRLSMYSLDTLRLNSKSATTHHTHSSATVKNRSALQSANNKKGQDAGQSEQPPKSQRKSPKSTIGRRPLMRDPMAGRVRPPRPPRAARGVKDHDVSTMVEAVEAVMSPAHVSREPTPESSPQRKKNTPRAPHTTVTRQRESNATKKSHSNTPRKERHQNPKINREPPPKPPSVDTTLSCIKSVTEELDSTSQAQVTPILKISCAKKKEDKETEVDESGEDEECKTTKTESPKPEVKTPKLQWTPKSQRSPKREAKEKKESEENEGAKSPGRCEVTKLLKQLCSRDSSSSGRAEHTSGSKNAQLVCVNSSSPRPQPITPQLLKILEETIQKKVPKSRNQKARDLDKYRLTFNIGEKITDNLFQYRTKFVQHMLASPMYANSSVGKPWEMIGSVSEQIIDEVLLNCVKDLQLIDIVKDLYTRETSVR